MTTNRYVVAPREPTQDMMIAGCSRKCSVLEITK